MLIIIVVAPELEGDVAVMFDDSGVANIELLKIKANSGSPGVWQLQGTLEAMVGDEWQKVQGKSIYLFPKKK